MLVHHPYESFAASVERFIAQRGRRPAGAGDQDDALPHRRRHAVRPLADPRRRGRQAGRLPGRAQGALRRGAQHPLGRSELEKAGVHVVYGIVGLKTHTKTALVVRQDADGIRCYAHIGTGNYHPSTARLYTDLGLLHLPTRCSRSDVVELFHYLTGRSRKRDYDKLLVAPSDMRSRGSSR